MPARGAPMIAIYDSQGKTIGYRQGGKVVSAAEGYELDGYGNILKDAGGGTTLAFNADGRVHGQFDSEYDKKYFYNNNYGGRTAEEWAAIEKAHSSLQDGQDLGGGLTYQGGFVVDADGNVISNAFSPRSLMIGMDAGMGNIPSANATQPYGDFDINTGGWVPSTIDDGGELSFGGGGVSTSQPSTGWQPAPAEPPKTGGHTPVAPQQPPTLTVGPDYQFTERAGQSSFMDAYNNSQPATVVAPPPPRPIPTGGPMPVPGRTPPTMFAPPPPQVMQTGGPMMVPGRTPEAAAPNTPFLDSYMRTQQAAKKKGPVSSLFGLDI